MKTVAERKEACSTLENLKVQYPDMVHRLNFSGNMAVIESQSVNDYVSKLRFKHTVHPGIAYHLTQIFKSLRL
jgi:hypothetical protein